MGPTAVHGDSVAVVHQAERGRLHRAEKSGETGREQGENSGPATRDATMRRMVETTPPGGPQSIRIGSHI